MEPSFDDVEMQAEIGTLNSAQRDAAIYREVMALRDHVRTLGSDFRAHAVQHDRELYGNPDTREEGLKHAVLQHKVYIDEQRIAFRTLRSLAGFLGLSNIAAWGALAVILSRGAG